MYLYNVTVKVSPHIHEAWLQWMKNEHLPAVMATGCFSTYRLLRLREVDDSEGPTYATQYWADTYDNYRQYVEGFAPELRRQVHKKWGDEVIAFRTLMEEVH